MKEKAVSYFNNGYSCSESIIQAAIDEGLCSKELLPCATTFSGGMSSGCLCGAVAASQMILGYNFGRDNSKGNEVVARKKAAEFMEEFKKINKVTCCRILSKDVLPMNKKAHCSKFVSECAEILESMLKVKV
ncbi:MAG: C_GCAxxG_C_C family protein [Cyanobacteria bacterium SIG32]|nr:C_GCAxxG_C_C family protein [Cyanobacteria bacterium SIG32]